MNNRLQYSAPQYFFTYMTGELKRAGSCRRIPTSSQICSKSGPRQSTYQLQPFRPKIHDALLEWMRDVLLGLSAISAESADYYRTVQTMERRLTEYCEGWQENALRESITQYPLFTKLALLQAFTEMDQKYRMTRRIYVPISIHECRQIVNLAQVLTSAPKLKLITFDGDETLYPDGQNFDDAETSNLIIHILKSGCHVALVTAAGYGENPDPYLTRLGRLIPDIIHATKNNPKVCKNFWVFGGESNYLFNLGRSEIDSNSPGKAVDTPSKPLTPTLREPIMYSLDVVPYREWECYSPIGFTDERDKAECIHLLDTAEAALLAGVSDLNLRAKVIRKERAVGVSPGGFWVEKGSGARKIKTEILEELVSRVRFAVKRANLTIPYCAFNGGSDVWVDVGNKAIAIQIMKNMLNFEAADCLHVGDQFTESGNDTSVRNESPCIWIINPDETKAILRRICEKRCITYRKNNLNEFNDSESESPPTSELE